MNFNIESMFNKYLVRRDKSRDGKNPINDELVRLARRVEKSIKKTKYDYVTKNQVWDPKRGIFYTDCSGFIERLMEYIYRQDEINLIKLNYTDKTRASRFYARNFYDMAKLGSFAYGEEITDIEEVEPGDLFIIKYPQEAVSTGHIMVVDSKPELTKYSTILKTLSDKAGNFLRNKKTVILTYKMGIIHSSKRGGADGISRGVAKLKYDTGKRMVTKIRYPRISNKKKKVKYIRASPSIFLRLYR